MKLAEGRRCLSKKTPSLLRAISAFKLEDDHALRLLTHVGFLLQNGLILSEVFLYMERSKNQEKNIS